MATSKEFHGWTSIIKQGPDLTDVEVTHVLQVIVAQMPFLLNKHLEIDKLCSNVGTKFLLIKYVTLKYGAVQGHKFQISSAVI